MNKENVIPLNWPTSSIGPVTAIAIFNLPAHWPAFSAAMATALIGIDNQAVAMCAKITHNRFYYSIYYAMHFTLPLWHVASYNNLNILSKKCHKIAIQTLQLTELLTD